MRTGTVKTSTLLIPKRKTLREFGESVTDAEVDNFDELVKTGFVNYDPEQEEQIGEEVSEKRICIAEGAVGSELSVTITPEGQPEGQPETTSELVAAMTETVTGDIDTANTKKGKAK